ncbi:efflux RND transporter periplasmic adaptor subunit [Mucilaginibacter sp. P19]|uniref:RND family efflux transporter, MFP subunit n=1 Tax=Mucilaginibacter gossypii TaxID=551996 RepID=A0A1G8D4S8_9SPHI|nr:efflux RND transporter periplasmic adaptor subunit [Mucilaginibacter gossypii]SDH52746.1 RND family efflux transporter, MFP subunit [Mucilaginibacter gossypii]
MKNKYILLLVVISIVALIAIRLHSNKKQIDEKERPAKVVAIRIPVRVAHIEKQTMQINIVKTGNLTSFKEAKALAVTSGTLSQVRFNLGEQVSQGQVLAITDILTQQLELEKAETSMKKLRNDLDTYTELFQGKAATQEQVNNIHQDYLNAVNQTNQARKALADASIRAPISGIIATKPVEKGVYVSAGAEITTIVDLSSAKVRVNLTEAEVYQVVQGQQVKIITDVYPGKVFNGRVTFISPQGDQAHNYMTEIQINQSQKNLLRSGTFVRVDFSRKTSQQLLIIPREALMESESMVGVYVVRDGVARLKKITTGAEMGSEVVVTSGLNEGDEVVTSGQINLKDGTAVSVSK